MRASRSERRRKFEHGHTLTSAACRALA
jgi:hypothetical protein